MDIELYMRNHGLGGSFYSDRYAKFISRCSRYNETHDVYVPEHHHVFPKSLFPDMASDPDNIVVLSARQHYLAHWMLAKVYGGNMWFAFNMMKRVIVKSRKTSALYSSARKYISRQISLTNTGRRMSNSVCAAISVRMKNHMVYRYPDGHTEWLPLDHIDVLNGIAIPAQTGSHRSDSTKEIMRDKSKPCNKGNVCYNSNGVITYAKSLPRGFKWGIPPDTKVSISKTMSKLKWYTWPGHDMDIRVPPGSEPAGWVPGRSNGPGFSLINEKKHATDRKPNRKKKTPGARNKAH